MNFIESKKKLFFIISGLILYAMLFIILLKQPFLQWRYWKSQNELIKLKIKTYSLTPQWNPISPEKLWTDLSSICSIHRIYFSSFKLLKSEKSSSGNTIKYQLNVKSSFEKIIFILNWFSQLPRNVNILSFKIVPLNPLYQTLELIVEIYY